MLNLKIEVICHKPVPHKKSKRYNRAIKKFFKTENTTKKTQMCCIKLSTRYNIFFSNIASMLYLCKICLYICMLEE